MPSSSERIITSILQTESIGRFSRKIVHISLRILAKLTDILQKVHSRLPYVEKLRRSLNEEKIERVSAYYRKLMRSVSELPIQPKISVLIPVYKVDVKYLEECLLSVTQQLYKNWEICVVDDCSNDPKIVATIAAFQERFPNKIKFSTNEKNSHISITSNNCLSLANGEYIALLDNDDRIYPNALAEVVRAINSNDSPEILYSDERQIDEEGHLRFGTYRKPAWSPFMHLCMNYTTHLSVYRTDLIRGIGGFRKGYEGSQDHDLMLRAVEASQKPVVHIPICLYQWRAHPLSTAASVNAKPYAAVAGEKAVREALERRGRPADVEYDPDTVHYRLKFKLLNPESLVSIIIDARRSIATLDRCLKTVLSLSTYAHYEIIVVGRIRDTDSAQEILTSHQSKAHPLSFVANDEEFSGYELNSIVDGVRGAYLLFLNSAVEVIEPRWIEEMIGLGQFAEVGAVGPKIRLENGKIYNAGAVFNPQFAISLIGSGFEENHPLYYQVLRTIHECAAFNADGLLVAKTKFQAVGGFKRNQLATDFSFVELCISLNLKGYSNIFTPFSRLQYIGQPSLRMFDNMDVIYFRKTYSFELINDPFLNPNLYFNANFDIHHHFESIDLTAQEFQYFLKNGHERYLT